MANGFTNQVLEHAPAADEPSPVGERFDRFVDEQREALVTFLCTRLPIEADAQDAAQESFSRLVRYRDTDPPESWRLLLYRIAVNVAHDQMRRAKVRCAGEHVPYEEALNHLPSEDAPQDEQVAAQQLMDRFWEVILSLPPRTQEIYVLNRVEGMSYAQVARHCGISVKAVEKHMSRALAAVRKGLGTDAWNAF